jgi:hypothetical protein
MAELRELQEEAAALKIEIAELESTLAAKKARRDELTGGLWSRNYGLINHKIEEREKSLRWEQDGDKPIVVWNSVDRFESRSHVVSRVTPKRIYVRVFGESRESQYNRDGTPVGGYGRSINVEATLGELASK